MWTLLVSGYGRWQYLERSLEALNRAVGLDFFDRRVLAVDGPPDDVPAPGMWTGVTCTGRRSGLTANLDQGFDAIDEDGWTFFLEEDFEVHPGVNLWGMAAEMIKNPSLAQMTLLRQPWSPVEVEAGGVLQATPEAFTAHARYLTHRRGFWLNPFVARNSLLRSLTPGVEAELTDECRQRGLQFGYWGGMDDAPLCTHIGDVGMGSPGWLR